MGDINVLVTGVGAPKTKGITYSLRKNFDRRKIRIGNHPTLDNFKENNGFVEYQLIRYYIPFSRKGKIATELGLLRDLKDSLPQAVKRPFFPVYNGASRSKTKVTLILKSRLQTKTDNSIRPDYP